MTTRSSKGFEISFDPASHILRIRAWGFWNADFMKKYDSVFTEKVEELWTSGEEWYVLMDLPEFYPQSAKVQSTLRRQITKAKEQGMKKLVYLGKRSAMQLQLNKLFLMSDIQHYSFVESEEEAINRLLTPEG